MPSETTNAGEPRGEGAQEPVRLGDRFEILPAQPLAALDGVAGPAFAARPIRGRKVECFAIVCTGTVPPRTEPMTSLISLDNPGIMRLIDYGPVDWERGRRRALVFERPLGRRLMTSLTGSFEPMSEDSIMRLVISAVFPVLRELSGRGITHGGIRPNNLFLRDASGGGVTLGECVSAPPGYGQPLVFECIERAMAHHTGRGNGTLLDDMYALAVTLAMLALGRNPVQEMDDEALLVAKIEKGSYAAILGNSRIPQNLTEPIRGMLLDDPKQRWGINQLDLWVSGRRLSPKQTQLPKRAARPLDIGGQEVWNCRALGQAISRNVSAAMMAIEGGELDRWLRRSMSDDALAETVAAAVEGATGGGGGGKSSSVADRVVARVAVAVDPTAPIRYKGKALLPEGLGVALADAFLRREGTQPLAEIIAFQLPSFWASQQADFRPELVPMVQLFDSLRGVLERPAVGFGIERVLYETNPHLHCLSPMVLEHHPATPGDLLIALDAEAGGRGRSREPMDRHIAAFLMARHRRIEEALFAQLQGNIDPVRRIVAMLAIFGDIQVRASLEPLPNLCRWLGSVMDPTFTRFHNRPQRAAAREQVEKAASSGKLVDLQRIIDNPEAIKTDALGFANARREHKKAIAEIEKLKASIADRDTIIETTGRQIAATLSSVVGTLIASGLGLVFVFG